jgi:hypothetical protein
MTAFKAFFSFFGVYAGCAVLYILMSALAGSFNPIEWGGLIRFGLFIWIVWVLYKVFRHKLK